MFDVLLPVFGALLGQFSLQLGAGHVPVPPEWLWVVPIASAGLVASSQQVTRYVLEQECQEEQAELRELLEAYRGQAARAQQQSATSVAIAENLTKAVKP